MIKRLTAVFLCVCMLITSAAIVYAAPDEEILNIRYKEYKGEVPNVSKGVFFTCYTSNPDEVLTEREKEAISGIYTRTHWNEHNPAEDVYDWTYYDELLRWCEENDKYLGFGIMNLDVVKDPATPMWVFEEAGARGLECIAGYGYTNDGVVPGRESWGYCTTMVPDYNDPIFWEKHDKFVKAMAERYDGHPRLAYVSMLTNGTYGEGGYARMYSPNEPLPVFTGDVWEVFYKGYMEYFKKTPLMYEMSYEIDEAAERGIGIRRNALMGPLDSAQTLARASMKGAVPVGHEFYGTYTVQKESGNIGNAWYPDMYMWYMQQAYSTYGCTSLDGSDSFLEEQHDMLIFTGDKLGYRWTVNSMDIPAQFAEGETVDVNINIENNGLARCHRGGAVRLVLLDEDDNVVANQWIEDADPKTWLEFNSYDIAMPVSFDNVSDGKYRLAIGINHSLDSDDMYNLANYDRTENGFYVLADVENYGKQFTVSRHESDETITLCAGNTELELGSVKTKGNDYFVPVRKICEGLGINLEYDSVTNSINLSKNEKKYSLPFGSNFAKGIGCESKLMKSKLETIDGLGYINAADIALLFDAQLSFDADVRNLILTLSDTDIINAKPYMNRYELVEDASFENGTDAWTLDATAFEITDETAATGEKSLKLTNTAPYTEFDRKKATQHITLDSAKLYKLSFKTKGDAKVRCRIYGNWDEHIEGCASEPSEDWTENTMFFEFKDTFFRREKDPYAYISFETTGDNGSVAYIDDVVLYTDAEANLAEKNKDGIEIYINGDFENDGKGWVARSDSRVDYHEENPHSGVGYGSVDNTGPIWGSLATIITEELVAAGPGKYKFTCYLRTDKPDTVVNVNVAGIRSAETVHNKPHDFNVTVGTEWQKIEWEGIIDWENSSPELDWRNKEMHAFGSVCCIEIGEGRIYIDDMSLKKIGELPKENAEN